MRRVGGLGSRAAWAGLVAGLLLVALAILVPRLTHWQVYARVDPAGQLTVEPLAGLWEPDGLGSAALVALALGVLACWCGETLAVRLPWGRLLALTYVASATWLLALALTHGREGIVEPVDRPSEYFATARGLHDVSGALHDWVGRIPSTAADAWPTHVAGHPPGALLSFVGLVRAGFDTPWSVGLAVVAIAASLPAAVLVTVRRLGAETAARRAAPFLVLSPTALFAAVSGDALFATVACWGLAALAVAATERRRTRSAGLAVVAGLLLGWCVLCSYGLPLLGLPALAVLVVARTGWRTLPVAAAAAAALVGAFALLGFAWWDAYPALRQRYWDGLASSRPGAYWTWGDLAAALISGGPLLAAGIAVAVAHLRRRRADGGWADQDARPVIWLAGAALAAIAIADVSQMSRAEVERIWLPFLPWITLTTALLGPRWRRAGLALQIATAVTVELLVNTTW